MAMTPTRRIKHQRKAPASAGAVFVQMVKSRLASKVDPRSHAEFLHDMRTKQSGGRLANPATAALLDRFERAIK